MKLTTGLPAIIISLTVLGSLAASTTWAQEATPLASPSASAGRERWLGVVRLSPGSTSRWRPGQSDAQAARLMVGAWRSPRHDYVYFADGTWWMGKSERGVTHGKWRIEKHRLVISTTFCGGEIPHPSEDRYPIQRLTRNEIVFDAVYKMKRIMPAQVER